MPVVLKLKRSSTANAVPASLDDGEIAINQNDNRLFTRSAAGVVQAFSLKNVESGNNLLNNPSFENGRHGWTFNASASYITDTDAGDGGSCVSLSKTSAIGVETTAFYPVIGDAVYSASALTKSDAATASGVLMRIFWYTAAFAAASTANTIAYNGAGSTTWTRRGARVAAPSDAHYAKVMLYHTTTSSATLLRVDAVSFAPALGGLDLESSIALAGNPSTTTQAATDNSARVATTSHVKAAIAAALTTANVGLNVLSFPYNADRTGVTQAQDAIQAAINDAQAAGGGIVWVPRGEYSIGKTAETEAIVNPAGLEYNYGLIIRTNVVLMGEGRGSLLKRTVADSLVMVVMQSGIGMQLRQLRIDGNALVYPITGDSYGAGGGVIVESFSGSQDKQTLINTVWIENTNGYGIGCEWGHHRGLNIDTVYIDGTGSDGIDFKRMYTGSAQFDAYGMVINNIYVSNFGRTATDAALQAGIDMRSSVLASNLYVRGPWGPYAQSGIRLRGGLATVDNSVGAQGGNLVNYYVERESGGAAVTYGLEVNADDCGSTNGTIKNCKYGIGHILAGAAADMRLVTHVNCRAHNCEFGFMTDVLSHDVEFIGCFAKLSTVHGFYLAGDRNKIIGGGTVQNVGDRITIVSGAVNTQVIGPSFSGTSPATINNAGSGTSYLIRDQMNYGDIQAGTLTFGSGSRLLVTGTGTPNGVISASPGSIYLNTNGGLLTTLYIKETGFGTNTGWVAK